jgi:hypothetical protein
MVVNVDDGLLLIYTGFVKLTLFIKQNLTLIDGLSIFFTLKTLTPGLLLSYTAPFLFNKPQKFQTSLIKSVHIFQTPTFEKGMQIDWILQRTIQDENVLVSKN